jgi:hypothetical protein
MWPVQPNTSAVSIPSGLPSIKNNSRDVGDIADPWLISYENLNLKIENKGNLLITNKIIGEKLI